MRQPDRIRVQGNQNWHFLYNFGRVQNHRECMFFQNRCCYVHLWCYIERFWVWYLSDVDLQYLPAPNRCLDPAKLPFRQFVPDWRLAACYPGTHGHQKHLKTCSQHLRTLPWHHGAPGVGPWGLSGVPISWLVPTLGVGMDTLFKTEKSFSREVLDSLFETEIDSAGINYL